MIILNPYKKNQGVLHNVIHEKPLPPIVYTTTRPWDGTYWENHITLCKAINIIATHSVCQTNNFDKTVIVNAKISLSVFCIEAESESIWRQYFFPACKKIDKYQSKIRVQKLSFSGLDLQARHMCPHITA